MTTLVVKRATVTDALGHNRTGWIVVEDGRPSYPHPSKDVAVKAAEAIKVIRCAPHVTIQVIG